METVILRNKSKEDIMERAVTFFDFYVTHLYKDEDEYVVVMSNVKPKHEDIPTKWEKMPYHMQTCLICGAMHTLIDVSKSAITYCQKCEKGLDSE